MDGKLSILNLTVLLNTKSFINFIVVSYLKIFQNDLWDRYVLSKVD